MDKQKIEKSNHRIKKKVEDESILTAYAMGQRSKSPLAGIKIRTKKQLL
jgi:hypothetical protein